MSHVGGDGQTHGGVTQQCLDQATMAQGKQTAADYVKANCSKNEIHRAGDIWTTDMVCKTGGSVMTTHSVTNMAGDDSAYHTDLATTFDPPSAGGGASTSTTVDGKWIGACKPT